MKHELEKLKKEFEEILRDVKDRIALEELKNGFLGRKGKLKTLLKDVATLADEERKAIGKLANEIKDTLEVAYGRKAHELDLVHGNARFANE